ncbi:hypothetical protein RFI_38626, partial [Reticulomyxa filosa]
MINSDEYMKQKLIIGPYSICSLHSKNIIFDDITIDGCVYVVDCIIDGIGNYKSVIRCHFNSHIFTYTWPIDTNKLMKEGKKAIKKFNLNEAIALFRFVLCVKLQTLHDSYVDVAQSYAWLGSAYDEKGEYNKSVDYFQKSLEIWLNKLGHDHSGIATVYNNLGL